MKPDAIVVGSGPNGLAAALTLARAGLAVDVYEGAATLGGGCRSEALTVPGFHHDVCSAVHPMAAASPFFRGVDLAARGVVLRQPRVAFAHPLDGGRAAAVTRSLEETADSLGPDAAAYRRLFAPLVAGADDIVEAVLGPIRSVPRRLLPAARFARLALLPAARLARRFAGDPAQALLAGAAAHAMRPLTAPLSGGFGLLLTTLAHSAGWPVVEGGSARIVEGLVAELESLGARTTTGRWIGSLDELPTADAVLLAVTPRQFVSMAGGGLGGSTGGPWRRFRYGPGVCKVDWALSGPVPWTSSVCREAGTLHLGGTLAEIARSEADVDAGRHSPRPFCIVAQPGVVDPSRAPDGCQTLWGYCHVPPGSSRDMTEAIEAQIERFAPGFSDLVLARRVRTAADLERENPNYVGGDINGGAATLWQTVFRPVPRWNPYRTPVPGVYLCSASTPPGGGVHGMCGVGAAQAVRRDLRIGRAGVG